MAVRKRSIVIRGHATSYSVENEFFEALQIVARGRGISLAAIVDHIDQERDRDTNLSSAIRLFVLNAARKGELPKLIDPKGQ